MTLASTGADPDPVVRLEEELHRLQQLRQRILESLDSGLQGPRHQHYLRAKLHELNLSIMDVRHRLGPEHPKFHRGDAINPQGGDHNRCLPTLRRHNAIS